MILVGGMLALLLTRSIVQALGWGGVPYLVPSPTPMESPLPASPSPSPVTSPTPTPTPTPSPKVTTKKVTESSDCSQFNPDNGPVRMRVTLQPDPGVPMMGRTVVRIKPTGTCPNESAAVEEWLDEGVLTWTSGYLNPGRYRIEIANGNYQGVVAETHSLIEGGYEYTIRIGQR